MESLLIKYLAVFFIGALLAYYFSSLKIREIAISSVRKHCQKMQLQLLDQSVSLSKVHFSFSKIHLLTLLRQFNFEFTSTGDERYRGEIFLAGSKVQHIRLQAHRMPDNINTIDSH